MTKHCFVKLDEMADFLREVGLFLSIFDEAKYLRRRFGIYLGVRTQGRREGLE